MDTRNEHTEDLLFNYFSGKLTESEKKELLQWLKADEANRQLLSQMADWWAIAHVPQFIDNKKSDFKKHFGTLTTPVVTNTHTSRLFFWGKVAASALVLISVGLSSYFAGKDSQITDGEELAYFETVVPLGSQTKVILPDHTVVWVNAGSSLRYAKNFNKQVREVSLNGEAYFEVTPDSLKPFVVKSERLDIRVLGTNFNVKAYPNDSQVDVALVSGKVKVQLNDEKAHSGEVTLAPDRMLSYNKETNQVKVQEVQGKDMFAWTRGRLKFAEQPFSRIAYDLERAYNVHVHINSEVLGNEVFSGSFDLNRSLDEVLQEVDIDQKYVWSRRGDNVIIEDK